MTASIFKCQCPKCGATVIVDASTDHSTCICCGTIIPNVLAKESEVPPAERVLVERPCIDGEKLDEATSSQPPSEATAAETPVGPTGTMPSVNSLWKVILVVILSPMLALATFTVASLYLSSWIGVDLGSWVVNVLAGVCTVGVIAFVIWTSIASFMSSSSGIPERQATERPLNQMPSRHVLSAFLIGVIWYWNAFITSIISSSDLKDNTLLWMVLIVLLSEGALGVSRNKSHIIGATGLGVLFGWMTEVIFTFIFPHISPVNHQLLPFEPVILAVVIIPPTILGNVVGKKLALHQDKKPNAKQKNNKLMLWLLTIAFILALASPTVGR